jgi:hypothetical protein
MKQAAQPKFMNCIIGIESANAVEISELQRILPL